MSLTVAERHAATAFRARQRALLEGRTPAGITVSVFVRHYRHDCAGQGGKSVNLELREHYVFSPACHACDCGQVCCQAAAHLVECDTCGPVPVLPERRFGWIWTEGRCGACGMTARSGEGRLVDPAVRPPAARALVSV